MPVKYKNNNMPVKYKNNTTCQKNTKITQHKTVKYKNNTKSQ
jgi:hypothetical protein